MLRLLHAAEAGAEPVGGKAGRKTEWEKGGRL